MTNLTREVLNDLPGWAEEAVLMGEAPVTVPGHHFGEDDVPDTPGPRGLEDLEEDYGRGGVPEWDGGFNTSPVDNNNSTTTTNRTGNAGHTIHTIHPNCRHTYIHKNGDREDINVEIDVEIEVEDDLHDRMMFLGKETQENLRKEMKGRGRRKS